MRAFTAINVPRSSLFVTIHLKGNAQMSKTTSCMLMICHNVNSTTPILMPNTTTLTIGYKHLVFSSHLTISGKPTTNKYYKVLETRLTENALYIS